MRWIFVVPSKKDRRNYLLRLCNASSVMTRSNCHIVDSSMVSPINSTISTESPSQPIIL